MNLDSTIFSIILWSGERTKKVTPKMVSALVVKTGISILEFRHLNFLL